jgi:hypothetical protein
MKTYQWYYFILVLFSISNPVNCYCLNYGDLRIIFIKTIFILKQLALQTDQQKGPALRGSIGPDEVSP